MIIANLNILNDAKYKKNHSNFSFRIERNIYFKFFTKTEETLWNGNLKILQDATYRNFNIWLARHRNFIICQFPYFTRLQGFVGNLGLRFEKWIDEHNTGFRIFVMRDSGNVVSENWDLMWKKKTKQMKQRFFKYPRKKKEFS